MVTTVVEEIFEVMYLTSVDGMLTLFSSEDLCGKYVYIVEVSHMSTGVSQGFLFCPLSFLL